MEANRLETRNGKNVVSLDGCARRVSPVAALRELYELLEAYSPMWYTEEAHNLARAACGNTVSTKRCRATFALPQPTRLRAPFLRLVFGRNGGDSAVKE